jgi:phenylacetate-CoA ligase
MSGDYNRYVDGFRGRDRWPEDKMVAYVDAELNRILLHAFDHVPYYARRWKQAGITRSDLSRLGASNLSRLPITPKTDLRLRPESFVAEKARQSERLTKYYSSGSTGTPVTTIFSADVHRKTVAGREVRSFGWAGTSVRFPRSMLGGRMIVARGDEGPPYYRYNWTEQQVYFSAYHISPDTVWNYVEGFNRYRPRLLTGYAFSHYSLARMMLEQRLTLDYQPDAIVLSSEKLTAQMKTAIAQTFRARAYEEYGAVENCMLATECEEGNLHASLDFGIIEIVDDTGNPVPPGVEGRVLCTGLLNHVQPLIRYDIGDCAVWSGEPCACGRRHLPVLKEIVGRLEDVVVGPKGREMVRFHGIFIDLPNVLEGQVIQEELDRLRVKVVALPGFGINEEALIRQRFEERLGLLRIEIERVPELERTDRGKFRAVISNLAKSQREPGTTETVVPGLQLATD